ncbi:MAG TPA: glycosyltransferase [Limnochordales bacterium]
MTERLAASVLIPSHNRRDLLRRTLLSLADQTFPTSRYEVVVVDDGSSDDTRQMVFSLDLPYQVQYVRRLHRGRGAALNAGVRAAASGLIIFLDSDIAAGRDFVAAHVRAHERPRRMVQGPVLPVTAMDAPRRGVPGPMAALTAWCTTGNLSVARMYVEEAGMFDEAMREEGWELVELYDRLRAMGLLPVREPRASGYRYLPPVAAAELDGLREQARARGRAGVVYYRKRPSWRARGRLGLVAPVLWLDRLLFPVEWADGPRFRRLVAWAEARRAQVLLRPVLRLVLHHAYVQGLREGLRHTGTLRPEAR